MRGERGKPQQDPTTATIEDETALDTVRVATTRRRDDVSLNRCVRISISVSSRD